MSSSIVTYPWRRLLFIYLVLKTTKVLPENKNNTKTLMQTQQATEKHNGNLERHAMHPHIIRLSDHYRDINSKPKPEFKIISGELVSPKKE